MSIRGFADYMLTEEVEAGIAKLRALTVVGRIALMCAEAVPWRCHRSLVSDGSRQGTAPLRRVSTSPAEPARFELSATLRLVDRQS